MIVDPTDENRAIDSDGTMMCAVRAVALDHGAPTFAELEKSAIIGYTRADGFIVVPHWPDEEPLA